MPIEYTILTAEEANPIDPQGVVWPLDTFVIVGTEDGKVVARMAAMPLTVIEGTWIAPEKRNGTIAVRLMQHMEELLLAAGKTHSMALVYDEQPEVAGYLERLGMEKFPVSFYTKDLMAAKKKEAA